MILISHRGNIDGPIKNSENNPIYIDSAISKGYDVEVDIWSVDDFLYLGHDNPEYELDIKWLKDRANRLWIHCKNIESLNYLKSYNNLNYFWHQNDDVTITSMGHFWTYPGKKLTKYSIAVMPEIKQFDDIAISYGICSDYIQRYKDL